MRLMLFFDLPFKTKRERRTYTIFRKYLISKGYIMIQYSVYVKLFANRDAAQNHVKILKRELPKKGQIRIMIVTEKQYARMEVILGGISRQEQVITRDVLTVL